MKHMDKEDWEKWRKLLLKIYVYYCKVRMRERERDCHLLVLTPSQGCSWGAWPGWSQELGAPVGLSTWEAVVWVIGPLLSYISRELMGHRAAGTCPYKWAARIAGSSWTCCATMQAFPQPAGVSPKELLFRAACQAVYGFLKRTLAWSTAMYAN